MIIVGVKDKEYCLTAAQNGLKVWMINTDEVTVVALKDDELEIK